MWGEAQKRRWFRGRSCAYVTHGLCTLLLRGTVCFLSVCLWAAVPGCSPHYNNSVWSRSPERSLPSSCPVNTTSRLDEGRGRAFIYFQLCLKRSWGNSPYATGSLRSVIVISMHLMSRLAHRNTYVGEGNNRWRGTSNDSDYYYYYYHWGEDVGGVVNQPHADCFPPDCLASAVICQSSDYCEVCRLWWFISFYKCGVHWSSVCWHKRMAWPVLTCHSWKGTTFNKMQKQVFS